jgi:hypothetical protein
MRLARHLVFERRGVIVAALAKEGLDGPVFAPSTRLGLIGGLHGFHQAEKSFG